MTDVSLEVTREEINSGVKKANNLNGTADEINEILGKVSGKQDTLVSGTNIKTINNKSILGSGNITIEGGSGGGSSDYYPPLLSTMWSDHLLNDESWLRADTFSWQDGTTYSTAYEKLVEEYNNGETVKETIIDGPNYTVVGDLIINNGIASGFTTSSYLNFGETFNPGSNLWEIKVKITTPSTLDSLADIMSSVDSTKSYSFGMLPFRIVSDGTIRTYISSNNSSWDIASALTGESVILPSTTYYLSLSFTGNSYEVKISTDNTNWTLYSSTTSSATVASSVDFRLGNRRNGSATSNTFSGSVDLSESYIKIANKIWWQGYSYVGSITYKRGISGFKIAVSSQEESILEKYNNNGIAWYYILDTSNNRFKLPRTKFGFEGLRDNVGDNIEESLPNITGTFTPYAGGNNGGQGWDVNSAAISGAFGRTESVTSHPITYTSSTYPSAGLTFNASNSSSTYQDGAPVQERATQMYLYFYVGEYAQTAVEQTAGLNAELFNRKVDTDLANFEASNLSTDSKNILSSLGMPVDKHIDLTLGASGSSYTAPASGYFVLRKRSGGSNQYIRMFARVAHSSYSYTSEDYLEEYIPVEKGMAVTIYYTATGTTDQFAFYYTNGSQSES